MKDLHAWLEEYGESHRHPVNIAIHKICVPAIAASLVAMLWRVPVPIAELTLPLNLAVVLLLAALCFYFSLSVRLACGMALIAGVVVAGVGLLDHLVGSGLLYGGIGVFVFAWVLQFIGHQVEGKRPSFFQDLVFLLVGPLWTLRFLYRALGIRV